MRGESCRVQITRASLSARLVLGRYACCSASIARIRPPLILSASCPPPSPSSALSSPPSRRTSLSRTSLHCRLPNVTRCNCLTFFLLNFVLTSVEGVSEGHGDMKRVATQTRGGNSEIRGITVLHATHVKLVLGRPFDSTEPRVFETVVCERCAAGVPFLVDGVLLVTGSVVSVSCGNLSHSLAPRETLRPLIADSKCQSVRLLGAGRCDWLTMLGDWATWSRRAARGMTFGVRVPTSIVSRDHHATFTRPNGHAPLDLHPSATALGAGVSSSSFHDGSPLTAHRPEPASQPASRLLADHDQDSRLLVSCLGPSPLITPLSSSSCHPISQAPSGTPSIPD